MADDDCARKRECITGNLKSSGEVCRKSASRHDTVGSDCTVKEVGPPMKKKLTKVSSTPRYGNRFSKMIQLGSGTFGEVWKAFDSDLDRWVAIKKFQEVRSEHLGVNMMIIREISLLRQLEHPNIARTLDVLMGKKMSCESLLLIMV